jgi:sec-independent protein translocase protein TatA
MGYYSVMFLREPSHILLLLIVVLVLFGAKRLPDSARSLAKSMRIFKSEMKDMKDMKDDDKKAVAEKKPEDKDPDSVEK